VLRLADAEADWLVVGIRRDAGEQLAQLFERVRVQAVEMWIHGDVFSLAIFEVRRAIIAT
jgi:hypothetical protein